MIPPLAIIQARLHSTRLPNKMLLDVGGHPLLWWAWNAAVRAFGEENVVIASPATDVAELQAALPDAVFFGWEGDENDVLGRVTACAHRNRTDPDTVIFRVTPDDLPPVLYRDHWTLAQLDMLNATIIGRDREHIGHLMSSQGGLEVNTQADLGRARQWYNALS